MTRAGSMLVLSLVIAASVSCGDDDGGGPADTGPRADTAPPPPPADTGTPPADTGTPPPDMGTPEDMGTPPLDMGPAATATVVDCAGVTPAATVSWSLASVGVTQSVALGGVVQWNVADALPHTVTSGTPAAPTGLFNEDIRMGSPVCIRFDAAGAYPFFCNIHRSMTGAITVE